MKHRSAAIAATVLIAAIISCNTKTQTNNTMNKESMQAVQFRIARPTNNLKRIREFYTRALGLEIIGTFKGHAGYDGIMLGMPDKTHHLEFTQYEQETALPQPTKEHLMVFYYNRAEAYETANERIREMGIMPVEPENPYWKDKSETYEDPDGWRIILFNGLYNP